MLAYFPPLWGDVDCSQCSYQSNCMAYCKFQRSRRDFSVGSGRCPRLPDYSGRVDPKYQAEYEEAFPLLHVQYTDSCFSAVLALPGERRKRKIYRTRNWEYYYRRRMPDGYTIKQAIRIVDDCQSREDIFRLCKTKGSVLLRCKIQDGVYL